jgi:lysophospholipase L1-like esterase
MNKAPGNRLWATAGALSWALFVAALAVGGGILVQLADPTAISPPEWLRLELGVAAGALAVSVLLGWACLLRQGRRLVFSVILWTSLLVVTAALAEGVARLFVPPWPARGLHGVPPAEAGPWATRATTRAGAVGVNSWGQRDRERKKRAPGGRRRIVFIGDSFLEESSTVPLPLVVEDSLGPDAYDVVNLGVSATTPDEYYWRLRAIALPLRPDHVVVLVYAGNDFITGPTLPSFWGLAAPYPKDSVLCRIGLAGLNHLIANGSRPALRLWSGGDVQANEERLHQRIRGATDAELPAVLAGLAPPHLRPDLVAHLAGRDLSAFSAGLREPDAGLFRSYYLIAALQSSDPFFAVPEPVDARGVHYVLTLSGLMADLCRKRGIGFTLAIAPEASQVDPRFQRFWGGISRLVEQKSSTAAHAALLVAAARARGIAVVDLSSALQGVAGTYYNLDGHWSDSGVGIAARALAGELGARLPAGEPGGEDDAAAGPTIATTGRTDPRR